MYDGQHVEIVDQGTWEEAQRILTCNGRGQNGRGRNKWGALLAGILRCGVCGAGMSHHYSSRKGKRYSSYVCATYTKRGSKACPGSRVPAARIEKHLVEHIKVIGRDPRLIAKTITAANGTDEDDLRRALERFDPLWDELFPSERARVLHLLIESVVYDGREREVKITFRPGGVRQLAGEDL